MKNDWLNIFTDGLVSLGLAISLVYTLGVVWRTEKRLDFSYKLTVLAIVSLLLSKLISLFYLPQLFFVWAEKILEILFVVFFLGGIWEMRFLIRKLDGEKPEEKE